MKKLKDCPFCGSEANFDVKGNIICMGCSVWISMHSTDDPAGLWNRRVDMKEKPVDPLFEKWKVMGRFETLKAEVERLNGCFESAQILWERIKPTMIDIEDVGLARNELNKIIGLTL